MSSCRLTWRCFCLLYHMLFISHSVVRMLQISFGLIAQSVAKAFNWDIEVTTTWKYCSRANMVSLMVTSLGLDRAAPRVSIQCNVHFARIHSCYTTFVADRRRLLRHSCCWAQRLLHVALLQGRIITETRYTKTFKTVVRDWLIAEIYEKNSVRGRYWNNNQSRLVTPPWLRCNSAVCRAKELTPEATTINCKIIPFIMTYESIFFCTHCKYLEQLA